MALFFTFFAVRLWSFCWRNDEKIQNLRVPYVSFFGRFSIFFTVPFLFFIFFTPAVFPMLSIANGDLHFAFLKSEQVENTLAVFSMLSICSLFKEAKKQSSRAIENGNFQSFEAKNNEKLTARVLWNKTC